MQIVINIPEDLYEGIERRDGALETEYVCDELMKSVDKGIPLPKGHGRLIDADELYGDFIDGTEGYDCQTWNKIEIGDIIDDAPTIIEADTEGEVRNEADS